MNGNQTYKEKYKNKIANLSKNNPDMEFLQGFINYIMIDMSLSSVYSYGNYIVRFIKTCKKEPSQLSFDDYTGYLVNVKDMTANYQIGIYSALKLFSSYLYTNHICEEDYMQHIKRPKAKESQETKHKREIGYLEENEIKKYLKDVGNIPSATGQIKKRQHQKERDLAIISLLLNTGMRCSALYKLDVDSIDFEKGYLEVIDKEGNVEEHYIDKKVLEIIKDWLKVRNEIKNLSVNEKALFVSMKRTRMDQSSIARVVEKYAVNIEGKNITPHKLRATYGTQIYDKTGDLYLVQQCMGHASPTTSELYIRGRKNESRMQGAQIMGKLISK